MSVTSARELAEREVQIEKSEVEGNPTQEREELQLIYESKGLTKNEADDLPQALMKDERTALDALSRDELGIDPGKLGGSARTAAVTSSFPFAVGTIVPVLPFFFVSAGTACKHRRGRRWALRHRGHNFALHRAQLPLVGTRQLLLGFGAAVRIDSGKGVHLPLGWRRRANVMSHEPGTADEPQTLNDAELDALQATTLRYYVHEISSTTGLIRDKTQEGAPSSIAAVGMALSTAPLVAERGIQTRTFMAQRVLGALRFFANCPQGPEPDATGYKGFYYHFLDMETGKRVWNCELSTIDSTFLFAGMLVAATYFDRDDADEVEIRRLARQLYEHADWNWARDGGPSVTHGWRPESGFIPYRWTGYDEALLLYVLGLGSPSHPLPEESYAAYTSTYRWKQIYEREYLYSGPLFTHQLSHMWIDFREIQDAFMRDHRSNYFDNSRHATYVQQAYAMRNPMQFEGYGEFCWGLTASDGPGWITLKVRGVERKFFDYLARGAPFGPDDGTIAPWATVASLPFAPEIVLPTIKHYQHLDLVQHDSYGFKATFNRTFPVEDGGRFWVSPYHIGIDQGPIALMIENYRSGLVWNLMRRCQPLQVGLHRAGFRGGWL